MKKTLIKEKATAILLTAIFLISTFAFAVTVSAYPPIEYSYITSIQVKDTSSYLILNVTENGEWVTWEFDFPVENFTGNGNLNVGLIIALDGEGEGPAFQIHNNDGATTVSPCGTWMCGSWGPTISDGWYGWPNHDLDVNVTDLDWVKASGNRNVPHGDGILSISIHESKLGRKFYWAASPTVGSGFYRPMYDVTMQVPTDFTWSSPLVDMTEPNYKCAEIVIPRPPPKKHGGPTYYDGVSMGYMWNTPHKLITVILKDAPIDAYYYLTVTILTEDFESVYTRTFYVRPTAANLALYLHESTFPENYSVLAYTDLGSLPYLVASRQGIEINAT